jgi:membrane-bound lytic murein transglycosylase F
MMKKIMSFFILILLSCASLEAGKRGLKEIMASKELRILTTEEPELRGLPRSHTPHHTEEAMLAKLAEKLELRIIVVYVRNFEELIPALLKNKGDIIASNMTVTPERRKKIAFTIPIESTNEQIVTSSKTKFNGLKDLAGQTVTIEKGACYWKNMERFRKEKIPSLKLDAAPDGTDTETLLQKTALGKIKYTVADSNYIDAFQAYNPNLKTVFTFPEKQFIAWGVRPGSLELIKLLNTFIKKETPEYKKKSIKGDLPEIKKRKILRVLTRNNPSCYFVHRGHLMGFEYELAKEFAKRNGLKLIMITPPDWKDLVPWLKDGKGDIIAAAVTITEKRKKIKGATFCHPYSEITEWIIARKDDKIKSLKDLDGRTIVTRKNSCYWETLSKLREKGAKFKLLTAPEDLETFEIIQNVANGKYDLTIADKNIADMEMRRNKKIKAALKVGEPQRYAWAVRSEDVKLKKSIDDFFQKEYKGLFFNTVYNKYFKSSKMLDKHKKSACDKKSFYISPYDPIIQKYSKKYSFHWCLIASQIFQESRFNSKVRAWDGGMGLMQLMPATAKELGCKNPYNPSDNIDAGVKYMNKLRKRAAKHKEIPDKDKICFALASYNGGFGHLLDARNLAEELNLDPNIWNDNVEKSYKLLSKKKYAARARYGYCRSDIIINYVNDIFLRYHQYFQEIEKNKIKKEKQKQREKSVKRDS